MVLVSLSRLSKSLLQKVRNVPSLLALPRLRQDSINKRHLSSLVLQLHALLLIFYLQVSLVLLHALSHPKYSVK